MMRLWFEVNGQNLAGETIKTYVLRALREKMPCLVFKPG